MGPRDRYAFLGLGFLEEVLDMGASPSVTQGLLCAQDHSSQCLGDHVGSWGLNLNWHHARQVPIPLTSHWPKMQALLSLTGKPIFARRL